MNAHLEAAKRTIEERRSQRPALGLTAVVSSQHQSLRLAYIPNGRDDAGPRFFLIRYCADCLRGTTLDLVRDVSPTLPDGRELGLKQMRPWQLECPEAQS